MGISSGEGITLIKKVKFTLEKLWLSLILLLSAVLNFTNLNIEGYANSYYAAGVKSMTMSWKNFFFVAFDPAGFVTIDKPPLGFWIQAISARIFGFSGWSILLPQALAGVISVALIYVIVKRCFGGAAGLMSALCLAITPVFVAVSRNNTVDNLLVMVLLFACWAVSIAAEKGKPGYLLLSLALVGIGFNIKMLQAYMIVPAIYITYLLSTSVSLKKRFMHLAAGTLVLLIISFSWAVIVDSVPASDRPYVGSSTNNSEMELIVGWNGLSRLGIGTTSNFGGAGPGQNPGEMKQGVPPNDNGRFRVSDGSSTDGNSANMDGQSSATVTDGGISGSNGQGGTPPADGNGFNPGGPGGTPPVDGNGFNPGGPGGTPPTDGNGFNPGGPGGTPPDRQGNRSGGGMGGNFGGSEKSGITRLFSNNSMSDQIIWLFPLALIGFIAAAIKERFTRAFTNDKKKLSLILWLMWLLPEFIYFSFSTGVFHPYYLTMLAAPIAALTGIGIVSMWRLYNEGGWKMWILPIALIADGLLQLLILSYYIDTSSITKVLMTVLTVLCFAASIALALINLTKNENAKLKKTLLSTAMIGLLIAPAVWSSTAMFYKASGSFPAAGLELATDGNKMGNTIGNMDGGPTDNGNSRLIEFLRKNKTNEKYLLVVSSSNSASDIIINSGESVMALGGFSGNDSILSLDQFKALAASGEIRYVMAGGMGGSRGSDIMTWVRENGTVVAESEWKDTAGTTSGGTSSNTGNRRPDGIEGGNSGQLYDLKAYADSIK